MNSIVGVIHSRPGWSRVGFKFLLKVQKNPAHVQPVRDLDSFT